VTRACGGGAGSGGAGGPFRDDPSIGPTLLRAGPHGSDRVALAINLELSGGRHGASARVEVRDRAGRREALLAVRGWLDRAAMGRLIGTLIDLSERGVDRLLLDCSALGRIDSRTLPTLAEALARFQDRPGGYAMCGLSPHLRDLLRLEGYESRLRCSVTETEAPVTPRRPGSGREWAS